jgi:hypothetical protein
VILSEGLSQLRVSVFFDVHLFYRRRRYFSDFVRIEVVVAYILANVDTDENFGEVIPTDPEEAVISNL